MPATGLSLEPKETLLSYEEIERLAKLFVQEGIRKIRITGGEPLVRTNIDTLFYKLGAIPSLKELALSTNGVLLGDRLEALRNSGVTQLNISLDTLHEERFHRITKRDEFAKVMLGIRLAASQQPAFRTLKINTVIMRGVNDDEILDFVHFASYLQDMALLASLDTPSLSKPIIEVRFIEFMPFKSNQWTDNGCVPYTEMMDKISEYYTLEALNSDQAVQGPAKSFLVKELGVRVGFISSMSDHFCGDCNRLRLTADGKLRVCLFGEDSLDLRSMLRSGSSDQEIVEAIHKAVALKWEKHPEAPVLIRIMDRDMVAIGG